jgi:hypothetical protein
VQSFNPKDYLGTLKDRASKARITQQFQLLGLEIATTLRDLSHKALYIKYAKELGADKMLALAKDIAQRRDVANRGAYFMRVVQSMKAEAKNKQKTPRAE